MIDIQASTFIDKSANRSIDNMPGYADRMLQARPMIDAARAAGDGISADRRGPFQPGGAGSHAGDQGGIILRAPLALAFVLRKFALKEQDRH